MFVVLSSTVSYREISCASNALAESRIDSLVITQPKMAKLLFILFYFLLIKKSIDAQDRTTKKRCIGVYK